MQQSLPELFVGDVVHHHKSLRQGKVIAVRGHHSRSGRDKIDIEFDEVQKPGVMYGGIVQDIDVLDGEIHTRRRATAFVKGPNKLLFGKTDDPEKLDLHYRYAGRFDDAGEGKGKGKDAL